MGIILLALIAAGAVPADSKACRSGSSCRARSSWPSAPTWAAGGSSARSARASSRSTPARAWRPRRRPPRSSSCRASSATRSTTHVATGSILGSGVGMPGAKVRWGVAGRMLAAWGLTLPAAGLVGAACYGIQHGIGAPPGRSCSRSSSARRWPSGSRRAASPSTTRTSTTPGRRARWTPASSPRSSRRARPRSKRRLDVADPFTDAAPAPAPVTPTTPASRQRAGV